MENKVESDLPLVTYLVITYNRANDLQECIENIMNQKWPNKEILIIDNASTDNTQDIFADKKWEDYNFIKYIRMDKNYGVCGGRNAGIKISTGEIIITIDDDAYFDSLDATDQVVKEFKSNPSLGVLAFRINNFIKYNGEIIPDNQRNRYFFPWKDKKRSKNERFETTWFIGAGHAIKNQVYKDVGLYRDFFPYGSEEYDMSLRIVDTKYRIIYAPQITVNHIIASTGRINNQVKLDALKLKHRVKAAYYNLPLLNVISMFLSRSLITTYRAKGNPLSVIIAGYELIKEYKELKKDRSPISKKGLSRLKELKGGLYW